MSKRRFITRLSVITTWGLCYFAALTLAQRNQDISFFLMALILLVVGFLAGRRDE